MKPLPPALLLIALAFTGLQARQPGPATPPWGGGRSHRRHRREGDGRSAHSRRGRRRRRKGADHQGAGLRSCQRRTQVPVTPETIFQSGSLGKQFTAAVMLLVDEGKLALGPLSKFYPEARRVALHHHPPPADAHLGPTQLHRRPPGLPPGLHRGRAGTPRFALPLDFAPGAQWSYSNTGYCPARAIISPVTGYAYVDVLRERLFARACRRREASAKPTSFPAGRPATASSTASCKPSVGGTPPRTRRRTARCISAEGIYRLGPGSGRRLCSHPGELEGNVRAREALERPAPSLWLRVGRGPARRPGGAPARRFLAGLPDGDCPLPR